MILFVIGVLSGIIIVIGSLFGYWIGCPKDNITESKYGFKINLKHHIFNMYGMTFNRYILFGKVVYETRSK